MTLKWPERNLGEARVFDIFCPENRQIRDESGIAERVGGGSECWGTSVLDVQISVRHCSDVTIVNTHSDGPKRRAKLLTVTHLRKSVNFSARC